jgi:hypothetical protein
MFRLIRVHVVNGTARVSQEPDGYTSEAAGWVAYLFAPGTITGIGHLDAAGRLVEVVVDPVRLVAGEWKALRDLARGLGLTVRAHSHERRTGRATVSTTLGGQIRREFGDNITDPAWRAAICAELDREPLAIDGLIEAIRDLTDAEVLDLFPALQQLATDLPVDIRRQLRYGTNERSSIAATAALRIGLSTEERRSPTVRQYPLTAQPFPSRLARSISARWIRHRWRRLSW